MKVEGILVCHIFFSSDLISNCTWCFILGLADEVVETWKSSLYSGNGSLKGQLIALWTRHYHTVWIVCRMWWLLLAILERWSKHSFSMTSFPQNHSICSANEILVPQTTNCTFDHKYISVTFTYLTLSRSKMHSSLFLSMWDHLNQSKLVWWFVKENENSCVQIFSSCSCCTHSLRLLAFVLLRAVAKIYQLASCS